MNNQRLWVSSLNLKWNGGGEEGKRRKGNKLKTLNRETRYKEQSLLGHHLTPIKFSQCTLWSCDMNHLLRTPGLLSVYGSQSVLSASPLFLLYHLPETPLSSCVLSTFQPPLRPPISHLLFQSYPSEAMSSLLSSTPLLNANGTVLSLSAYVWGIRSVRTGRNATIDF